VNRFNERFILSLASNPAAIFLDDQLNILPVSSHIKTLEKLPPGRNIRNPSRLISYQNLGETPAR